MFDPDDAVEALCAAVGPGERPVWTVFDRDDGEPDGFELVPGPGGLLGWRAPAEVWAIGMAAGGTATIVDGSVDRRRCQVACVVDRWGSAAGRIRFTTAAEEVRAAGGPAGVIREDVRYEAPQDGRMLDVLRRCLGLPTSPPTEPVACVLTLTWLVAVAAAARRRRHHLRWDAAVALHPAVALLDGPAPGTPGGRGRPGDPLASVIQAAVGRWSWSDVRARCIERGTGIADLGADLIEWMDDGMLSRWLCEEAQPIDRTVDDGLDAVHGEDRGAMERLLFAALESADLTPNQAAP